MRVCVCVCVVQVAGRSRMDMEGLARDVLQLQRTIDGTERALGCVRAWL